MTRWLAANRTAVSSETVLAPLLLAGFAAALWLRVAIGSPDVAHSALAGLAFACCLVALSWMELGKSYVSWKIVSLGLLGAAVLCVPVICFHSSDYLLHSRPAGNYLAWAMVVGLVATAEELFLRGALYSLICNWLGPVVAIIVGAVAFAALHVPLYGWHVVPLDFVVGAWLGVLRYASGSWVAPATTHIAADLIAWWIV